MAIRIGFDAIHVSNTGKGISRLQRGILGALAAGPSDYEYVVFVNARAELPDLPQNDHVRYVSVSPPNLFTWELLQLPVLARRHGLRLVQTMSDRVPLMGRTPFVMFLSEVPDYRHELACGHAGLYQKASDLTTRLVFPVSLRRAALIVVPSRFTGEDLRSRYSLAETKVRVVHESADDRFVPERDSGVLRSIRLCYGSPGGYILHFSSANDPRDNTETVLAAFRLALPALRGDKRLVIAGNLGPARSAVERLIGRHELSDRVWLVGYVPEGELVRLYQGADLYCDPSLYEGFGLQVLEAMACGVPVVCSNTTSLPELVGDAALTCAPLDVDGFGECMRRVLSDAALAAELRQRGVNKSKQYSWRTTARQLEALYGEVLS